jgi:ADP-ribose pyrophosphatase YjhB (NUDIX family)
MDTSLNYCSQCGHPVAQKIPTGDNRLRFVCNQCETVHYQNPRIITGCLPIHGDRVLLCRRSIEPRAGLWTLPAGFLENGETTSAGAERETLEEANARVDIIDLYTLFSLPHISQVYMFFRAHLKDLNFSPGEETLETRLFHEADIPWDELAFPVITETLRHYFRDRTTDTFDVRYQDLIVTRRLVP